MILANHEPVNGGSKYKTLNRGMSCGIKCIDMDDAIIYCIQRTLTNRIWRVVAAIDEEQHRCNAEEENKTEHLQFTISFVYFDSSVR